MAYSPPRTWVAAEYPTAAQLNQDIRDNQLAAFPLGVAAWTAYTPTLTQSATVTKTVTYAKYQRIGRTVFFAVDLSVTGTGTAANHVVIGVPVTAAAGSLLCGVGQIYDASAALIYNGNLALASTTTLQIWPAADGTASYLGARGFAAALASGDLIRLSGTYEAAS